MKIVLFTMAVTLILLNPMVGNGEEESPPKYSVPHKDLRHKDPNVVRRIVSGLSTGREMIIFFGDDLAMLHEIRSGASKAKDEQNVPIGATIQARGNNTVEFWIDGQFIDVSKFTTNYDDLNLETQTQFTLSWGNKHIIQKSTE